MVLELRDYLLPDVTVVLELRDYLLPDVTVVLELRGYLLPDVTDSGPRAKRLPLT